MAARILLEVKVIGASEEPRPEPSNKDNENSAITKGRTSASGFPAIAILTFILAFIMFSVIDIDIIKILKLNAVGKGIGFETYILLQNAFNGLLASIITAVLYPALARVLARNNLAPRVDALHAAQPKLINSQLTNQRSKSTDEETDDSDPAKFGPAIENLSESIIRLQKRSSSIYWTLILSLSAGILLIIFAGYLSTFDTTLNALSSQLDSDRRSIIEGFRFIDRDDASQRRVLEERLASIDRRSEKIYDAATSQITQRADGRPVWNWPSTVLRVGIIGLLVFLTQILISLYRYNSRIIAFYCSRREALLMANCIDDVEKLTGILYPANLDFGREPRHPFQAISSMLKTVASKPKKISAKKQERANGDPKKTNSNAEKIEQPETPKSA